MSRNAAIIAGILSVPIALWFLGWLVFTINQLPLWIIIGVTICMMLFDFYQSMKEETGGGSSNGKSRASH